MTLALAGAVAAMAMALSRPSPADATPTARRYPSVDAALRVALDSNPLLVAFGELHQTQATSGVPSALRRFTEQVLPLHGKQFSHLIVETWITTGKCGDSERRATADIEKTTERPPAIENEIVTLIRQAEFAGVRPRILSIGCADYAAMRPAGQSVDYDKTLRITARELRRKALEALRERAGLGPPGAGPASPASSASPSVGVPRPTAPAPDTGSFAARPMMGVYGGALHNDLHPHPTLAPYSFAADLVAATLGRYVEVDLVVPEYAATSAATKAQAWWKAYIRAQRPGATVLIRRSPRSFVIVFPGHAKLP